MERIKYTIASVQQKKLIELDLDIKDAFILSYLKDTIGANSKFISKVVDNEIYYWIKYSSLIAYLPILKIENEKVIARRFSEYEKLGLIKRHIHKVTNKITKAFVGNYTFINLTDKFSELFEENKIETDVDELEKAAKEMGLSIENNRENFSVPSDEPRELFSSFGENGENSQNIDIPEDIFLKSRGYSKVPCTEGTQKFRYNTTINNTNINNNTTTKLDKVNKIDQEVEVSKKNSSSSDLKNLDKDTRQKIKSALQNHGLSIPTCKNIMILVDQKGVDLDRIQLVLMTAKLKKWDNGAVYQALRDGWEIKAETSPTVPEDMEDKIKWLRYFSGIYSDKELRAEVEKIIINIPLETLKQNKSKLSKMTIFEFKSHLASLRRA
ncbi:hypothetical protein DW663_01300 [Fusobacterium mortiferum]|uniref:Uncharacterized protein n=1 Tax=Fusobacterium mortiferum TaxID=850 RepID=A0A414Q2M1_FUSMR|nr:hypothetical protein [Fusobacterium mortiferum]RHF75056.1 hypothetical protein DW663_01300 [Fusobacterium mortiferum]